MVSKRLTKEERALQYKPGSIRRVKLKNFLTYADVECFPGPRLNIVIGPNGTGKSTILCAICLGLGGQPPLLGRADDARLFIMHEKDIAEIEIELAPYHNHNNNNNKQVSHVFKRVIDRNKGAEKGRGIAASTFYINNQKCSIKEVQKIVSETYNISIDNLCTFLPQDRVGSFSGFDAKMLLQETEKSLSGSQHLFQEHQRLIDMEETLRNSGSNVHVLEEKLTRAQREYDRLTVEKQRMEERQNLIAKLTLHEQKYAWVLFDNKRDEALALKENRDRVKKELLQAQKDVQPLEDKLGQANQEVVQCKNRTKAFDTQIMKLRHEYEDNLLKAEKYDDEIDNVFNNLNVIDTRARQAQNELVRAKRELEDKITLLQDYPPEDTIQNALVEAKQKMSELRKRLLAAKNELESKQTGIRDKGNELDILRKKYDRMQDEKARRNERIFSQDPKLKEVYDWVNQNRKMFRRTVWGPIVCEITTHSTATASYLEQHVPNAALKSFVVECKEDYNLLYREVREKKGLAINIQTVEQGLLEEKGRIYSDGKMQVLKREHGVVGYLDETFDAPQSVIQALRNSAQVDRVLVGNEKTYNSLDRNSLLSYLSESEDNSNKLQNSCIFASYKNRSYKYQNNISRYSGHANLSVDEVPPAKKLAPGVSPEQKAALEKQVAEVEEAYRALEPGVQQAQSVFESLQQEAQELNVSAKDAQKAREDLDKLNNQINRAKRKVKDAEAKASIDSNSEKRSYIDSMKSHISGVISLLEKSNKSYQKLINANGSLAGMKMTEDALIEQALKIRDLLEERKKLSVTLERDYNTLSASFHDAKKELNELKQKADRIAPIRDESGDLPLKDELSQLPNDIQELLAIIEDARDRIKGIQENHEALRKWEDLGTQIEATTKELENIKASADVKKNEIQRIQEPWEASLVKTVDKVNSLFSTYMMELGFAGEVSIARGRESQSRSRQDDDNEFFGDFKNWGIQIKVKFREKSELQVLSAQVQSGGERSVSTIMYLMALQDLMVSPFRCVDEINQGLDERNERLVFRRIVHNSTLAAVGNDPSNHSGQYFLITPKLLPNLTDMENEDITVLLILNGAYNFKNYSDWNTDLFLTMRSSKSARDNSEEEEENSESRLTDDRRKKRLRDQ